MNEYQFLFLFVCVEVFLFCQMHRLNKMKEFYRVLFQELMRRERQAKFRGTKDPDKFYNWFKNEFPSFNQILWEPWTPLHKYLERFPMPEIEDESANETTVGSN